MNHTRFPEEDHLPDWARRDNKVTKGDRVDGKRFFIVVQPNDVLISKPKHVVGCV